MALGLRDGSGIILLQENDLGEWETLKCRVDVFSSGARSQLFLSLSLPPLSHSPLLSGPGQSGLWSQMEVEKQSAHFEGLMLQTNGSALPLARQHLCVQA